MTPLEVYNHHYKLIQSIYTSRLKLQILLSLSDGPKSLADLREISGSTSQALIPKIRGLERLSLIEPLEHGYTLTSTGKIVVQKIETFVMTMGAIMEHKDFWATHYLEGIPQPFLSEIGEIVDSDVKHDTTNDMFHVFSQFIKILRDARFIHGISSVMSVEIADVLAERILAGVPVELIVNRSTGEGLLQEPYVSKIRALADTRNFLIWVTDEPFQVGITVTDKYLSFGMSKKDGSVYDSSSDLTSTDPRALAWAQKLFDYYKARSTLLSLQGKA